MSMHPEATSIRINRTATAFAESFIYSLPNVPSDLSLLAFGIPPAREAELAGGMPKVPKGQGLGRLARWAYILFVPYVGSRA